MTFASLFTRPDGTVHPVVKTAAHTAAWVTLAVTMVASFEGLYTHAYRDAVGVKTICYGATAADHVDFNRTYTPQQCKDMLGVDLQKYDVMVHSCIKVPLPPHREAALVSFTYNLGQGALCKGAVARNLNAGNVTAGCNAMLAYNHAGGKVLRGLTTRRQQERTMCLRND